jgi:glutamate-1-semialdehyde 2,1-aminomutase
MILAVLQARATSTRLPGKVLRPILGKPMLAHQVARIRRSRRIERLILATSDASTDDPVAALAGTLGLECFRGSLDDVLDRFYRAAAAHSPDHVVRLTGDCPLADPEIIDRAVELHLASGADYTSNCLEPTWPDGLDVEVCRFPCLEEAWKEARLPSQREHVMPFVNRQPRRYRIVHLKGDSDLSRMRWTVDEPEDLEFVRKVYEALHPSDPAFSTSDVLALLGRDPGLAALNARFTRNEGLEESLRKDRELQMEGIRRSLDMQERARKRIPGMTQLLSKRPDQFSLGVWPGYYSKAKGAEVWDLDGNRYLDMSIGGIGANVLGYGDPEVDQAVREAVEAGVSSSLNCPEEVELAELLCEIHPWADKVRYTRTGGESMAMAVRIARAATGRDEIAFCGYHGWHDWYLAANLGTEDALGGHLLSGLDPAGVPKVLAGTAHPFRYNRLEELESIVARRSGKLAAVVLEPIRNDSPAPGFLEGVRRLAASAGAVLIMDEISAGFRLNSGGAHLTFGLEPDIAVFSKALGNGYAIGAVIGREEVMDAAQRSFISSTCWTERIGPAAALAMIRKHRRVDAGRHLVALGRAVQDGWNRLGRKHGIELHAGGIPPLSHFSFAGEGASAMKALFVQLMLDRGFLAGSSFYAMLAHTRENVDAYLAAADEAFAILASAGGAGGVERMLRGKPSVSGFKRLN